MKAPATVLVVMRNTKNQDLISRCLAEHGYTTTRVSSLVAAEDEIDAGEPPQGAVVDLTGFSQKVWSFCERLRACSIPFMVLSPSSNPVIRREGQNRGAYGVHVKPIAMLELVSVIDRLVGR